MKVLPGTCEGDTQDLPIKAELLLMPHWFFWSFLQNPVEFRGFKFGRDTSQNYIPGDKYLSSLHSSTYSYQTPTRLLESYQTELGLGHISCWLITMQILYPSPSGVLLNSYWNDPKSQEIVGS